MAFIVFGASRAHAATPEQAAAADALFKEARALLKDNRTAEACAKFAASQELDPQVGTLANLATCHVSDGKLAAAYMEFTELAERAAAANDKTRATFAEKKIAELKPQIVALKITVEDPAPSLKIVVSGREITRPMWDRTLVYDPGPLEISATAAGRAPWRLKLVAAAGAQDVVVVVPRLADEPALVGPPRAETRSRVVEAPASPSGRRTAAFVAFGLGAAGLSLGTAFGISALSSKSAADDACPRDPCAPEDIAVYKSEYSHASSSAMISTVGFGVGVAALAIGLYLLVTDGKPAAPATAVLR